MMKNQKVIRNLAAAFSGGLFGLGLMVSGMTDTTKVQGWLDIFGDWDPTLAFVLGGAILPMTVAWIWIQRRGLSLLGNVPPIPAKTEVDRPLIWGAVIFGAGWGLAGLCPGPAMASLSWGGVSGITFFAAMIFGMWLTPGILARIKGPGLSTGTPKTAQ